MGSTLQCEKRREERSDEEGGEDKLEAKGEGDMIKGWVIRWMNKQKQAK